MVYDIVEPTRQLLLLRGSVNQPGGGMVTRIARFKRGQGVARLDVMTGLRGGTTVVAWKIGVSDGRLRIATVDARGRLLSVATPAGSVDVNEFSLARSPSNEPLVAWDNDYGRAQYGGPQPTIGFAQYRNGSWGAPEVVKPPTPLPLMTSYGYAPGPGVALAQFGDRVLVSWVEPGPAFAPGLPGLDLGGLVRLAGAIREPDGTWTGVSGLGLEPPGSTQARNQSPLNVTATPSGWATLATATPSAGPELNNRTTFFTQAVSSTGQVAAPEAVAEYQSYREGSLVGPVVSRSTGQLMSLVYLGGAVNVSLHTP